MAVAQVKDPRSSMQAISRACSPAAAAAKSRRITKVEMAAGEQAGEMTAGGMAAEAPGKMAMAESCIITAEVGFVRFVDRAQRQQHR